MSIPPKKRNRKILVCSNCRSKKNKCDRNKPCGSCVKLGLQSTCLYSDVIVKPSPSNEDGTSSFLSNLRLVNTCSGSPLTSAIMNSLERPTYTVKKFPPTIDVIHLFTFLPMDPKDPATKMLWRYWSFQVRDRQFSQFTLSRHCVGLPLNKITELEKSSNVQTNELNYLEFEKPVIKVNKLKTLINGSGNKIGIKYHPTFELRNKSIIQKLKIILPRQIQLINYQKIFFDKLSMYIPVLDEFEHFETLRRLFNIASPSDEKVVKISITSKHDYALIAQVLITLRLTYLYLLSNDIFNLNGDDTDIFLEAIDLAEECLHIHGFLNQQTLPCLQALILLQFYREIAPERQGGFFNDQILRGQILEMAYALGFHKDPRSFELRPINDKEAHFRRKIWYHIYQSNIYDSVIHWMSGRHLDHVFDTTYPKFTDGLSNHRNPINEKRIIDGLSYSKPVLAFLSKILKTSQEMHPNFDSNLLSTADGFRFLLEQFCGTYTSICESAPGYFKIIRFKTFLYGRICLTVLYYSGYLHYEDNGDITSSIVCLKRCFEEIHGQLSFVTLQLVHNSAESFGKEFKFLITYLLILAIHLTITMSSNVIIRLKSTIESCSDAVLLTKLSQLIKLMKKFTMTRIKYLIHLSTFSHFCSKILKAALHNMLLIFDDDGIYKLFPDNTALCNLTITVEDTDELIGILKAGYRSGEPDTIDDVNIFSISDILKPDPDYITKMTTYVQYDKLWTAKTYLNMSQESDVPKDDEDEDPDKEVEFDVSVVPFTAVPIFTGVNELIIE